MTGVLKKSLNEGNFAVFTIYSVQPPTRPLALVPPERDVGADPILGKYLRGLRQNIPVRGLDRYWAGSATIGLPASNSDDFSNAIVHEGFPGADDRILPRGPGVGSL